MCYETKAQRIAIAEWCGWKLLGYSMMTPVGVTRGNEDIIKPLPDYLNDQNSMWEAESKLSPEEWGRYARSLASNDDIQAYAMIHATPRQRAKSLLKSINLWRDEE